MNFSKERWRILLMVSFSIFLIVQGIALQYGRSYRKQIDGTDRNGHDKLAMYEVNQLQEAWRQAAVEDLIAPEKLADQNELLLARVRLKKAAIEIQNSENRVQKVSGKQREFFKKLHAYYHNSISAIIAIIDFLLTKKGEYSVNGNEINFTSETDGELFRILISHVFDLYREKQELDAFVLQHNTEVEKSLSGQ